jgi:hypothetical protein
MLVKFTTLESWAETRRRNEQNEETNETKRTKKQEKRRNKRTKTQESSFGSDTRRGMPKKRHLGLKFTAQL